MIFSEKELEKCARSFHSLMRIPPNQFPIGPRVIDGIHYTEETLSWTIDALRIAEDSDPQHKEPFKTALDKYLRGIQAGEIRAPFSNLWYDVNELFLDCYIDVLVKLSVRKFLHIICIALY